MAEVVNKVTYTKEQIIGSKKYAGRVDLLSALLEPGKSYMLEEVDKKMEKYMKGAVRFGWCLYQFYFGGARDHESVRAWRGIHAS